MQRASRFSPDEDEVASYCAFYALAVLSESSNTELQIYQTLDTFKVTILSFKITSIIPYFAVWYLQLAIFWSS